MRINETNVTPEEKVVFAIRQVELCNGLYRVDHEDETAWRA